MGSPGFDFTVFFSFQELEGFLHIHPKIYFQLGVNGKLGCVANWSRRGSLSFPGCDDFVYKSIRFNPPSLPKSASKKLFHFESDFSVDFLGAVFSGRRAIETVAFLLSAPPEIADKVARELGVSSSSWELGKMPREIQKDVPAEEMK